MERPELIDSVCKYEWDMFSAVNNNGGKASCQNDEAFFKKMRVCQFAGWSDDMLASYLVDLVEAAAIERNLPMEKYAWMMESTHPAEFEQIRPSLPDLSAEQLQLIGQLVQVQVAMEEEVDKAYPYMRANGRPLRKEHDTPYVTSFETYLEGELKTYSLDTLHAYAHHIAELYEQGGNLALLVAEATAKAYGFESLDAFEAFAKKKAGA